MSRLSTGIPSNYPGDVRNNACNIVSSSRRLARRRPIADRCQANEATPCAKLPRSHQFLRPCQES
jgi:hypothetical protein